MQATHFRRLRPAQICFASVQKFGPKRHVCCHLEFQIAATGRHFPCKCTFLLDFVPKPPNTHNV
jgi:hypothetical protein